MTIRDRFGRFHFGEVILDIQPLLTHDPELQIAAPSIIKMNRLRMSWWLGVPRGQRSKGCTLEGSMSKSSSSPFSA